MAYSQDLVNAARRHLDAAKLLDSADAPTHRRKRDVAGYLYGVAAECALKQIMRETGIRPMPATQRRDDPFYAHFPELKTMLLDTIKGRRGAELRRFAEDAALMQEWDTDMRYAPAKDIQPHLVDRWRDDASKLVNAMEAP